MSKQTCNNFSNMFQWQDLGCDSSGDRRFRHAKTGTTGFILGDRVGPLLVHREQPSRTISAHSRQQNRHRCLGYSLLCQRKEHGIVYDIFFQATRHMIGPRPLGCTLKPRLTFGQLRPGVA